MSDARLERRELRQRRLLCRLVHPRRAGDALLVGRAEVLDELGHLLLGRRWVILRDVNRADRLAERAVHQLHAALPALALRLYPRERLREEVEARVVERLRQVLG